MKDVIILDKARKKTLSEGLVDITTSAEMAQALSSVNFAWRYKWAISIIDMDVAKELGLTRVKKY